MTSSSDTIAKTTGLGMHAVARHLLDHDLPAPTEIGAPRGCLDENSIRIHLWAADAPAWVNSIVVDDHETGPTTHPDVAPGMYERAIWHGRLPDSGVRVSLVTVRRIPAGEGRRALIASVPA